MFLESYMPIYLSGSSYYLISAENGRCIISSVHNKREVQEQITVLAETDWQEFETNVLKTTAILTSELLIKSTKKNLDKPVYY